MRLLDAGALLALFFNEPAGPRVVELLERGRCGIPATCVAEVTDRAIRRAGISPAAVGTQIDLLVEGGLEVIEIDHGAATKAGRLRAGHYHRSSAPLSLADCVLIALASDRDQIATSDPPLAAVAGELGVEVIRLPSSREGRAAGRR